MRTGVFPFGAQTVSEVTTAQEATDRNFTDTVRRSENDAVERGMSEAAAELVRFFAKS